jgi:hypothetical protein
LFLFIFSFSVNDSFLLLFQAIKQCFLLLISNIQLMLIYG